jgi:hypothetical protein
MQTIQLVINDPALESGVRAALIRSGPWRVESIARPGSGEASMQVNERCVLVMDEECFNCLSLPLPYPERIVLVTRQDPVNLAHAWEAGIVSVVSPDDPPNTILLAIMAAALRIPKLQTAPSGGGISPNKLGASAPISPELPLVGARRYKHNSY